MLEILYIIILVFLFFFLIIFLIFYLYQLIFLFSSAYKGAPFVISSDEKITAMMKLLDLKKGVKIADIGSGDGKILIAFAQKGFFADGYELNPLLLIYSRWKVKRMGLEKKVRIYWQNIWNTNFNKYDVVTVYGIPGIMEKLEKQLKKQLKPKAKILSIGFKFPTLKISNSLSGVYLYIQNTD